MVYDKSSSPSADKLRAKAGRTMLACAAAGHSKFLLKPGNVRTQWGKIIAALVLPDLQGKACAAKKHFC
jgi:hypothetical protein